MADFKFDRRAIDQIAKDAVKGYARKMQPLLDQLARTQGGKPIAEVKVTLQREWERAGNKITEPDLTRWAETLASGSRIVLQP